LLVRAPEESDGVLVRYGGTNDAPRTDVGKVALCQFVLGVIMEDY
jgi:hypothetical protein